MKKLAFLGGAGALGAAALFGAPLDVRAADHLDSPSVKMSGREMGDINDVYAWMTSDGAKVNLALTVSPHDDAVQGGRHFGPSIQYVFHIEDHGGLAIGVPGMERKIICTFLNDTNGQCWLTNANNDTVDYVSGDLSPVAGKASASNKFRVFAGRRSDPFFFNFSGFLTAKKTVNDALTAQLVSLNANGCPDTTLAPTTADTIRQQLAAMPNGGTENGPCALTDKDCFKTFNVMAIVIQVDKDLLLTPPNQVISVWATTHAAQ